MLGSFTDPSNRLATPDELSLELDSPKMELERDVIVVVALVAVAAVMDVAIFGKLVGHRHTPPFRLYVIRQQ